MSSWSWVTAVFPYLSAFVLIIASYATTRAQVKHLGNQNSAFSAQVEQHRHEMGVLVERQRGELIAQIEKVRAESVTKEILNIQLAGIQNSLRDVGAGLLRMETRLDKVLQG